MSRLSNYEWGWTDITKKLTAFFVSLFLFCSLIYYFFPASFGKVDSPSLTLASLTDSLSTSDSRSTSTSHPLTSLSSAHSSKQARQTIGPKRPTTKERQPPTRFPSLVFPPDDGGKDFDFQFDIRPENDLVLQAQSLSEDEKLHRLELWLQRNGGRSQGYEFRTIFAEYRGVFATENMPSGFEFMYVPAICMLDHNHFNNSLIGKVIKARKHDWSKEHHISIFYWYTLIERFNPNSFWKYWYAVLPLHYKTVPLFWDNEQIEWLKGTYAHEKLLSELKESKDEYEYYTNLIPALKVFTLEQYTWSVVCLASRIWGTEGHDTAIPLLDMINHNQPVIHLSHEWTDEGTSYVTTENITKGSQLFFHYGNRAQTDWLLHYGFTAPDNLEFNIVYITMTLPLDDALVAEKTIAMGGWNSFECDLTLHYDMTPDLQKPSHYCWSFVRVAGYQGNDISKVYNEYMGPISVLDELRALEYFSNECQKKLKTFPTTYAEDLVLLEDKALSSKNFNYYNALIVRSQEKQIYNHIVTLHLLFDELVRKLKIDVDEGTGSKVVKKPGSSHVTAADPNRKTVIDKFLKESVQSLKDKYVENYFNSVLPLLFPEVKVKKK